MTQTLPSTTSMTAPSSDLNSNTPATICTDASPWTQPELEKSPDHTLELLRETQHMLKALEEKQKRLKGDVEKLYQNGRLAHLVDENNSQKFNGHGISVTLCPGKAKRVWSPEVQQQLDVLQAQITKIELTAEARHQYQETRGKASWRVNLQKEL